MKTVYLILILSLLPGCTENSRKINMGIFEKLFGEKHKIENKQHTLLETAKLEKSGNMMREDQFWNLIDKSLENTSNQDQQETYLVCELQKLSLSEIIGFRLRTDKLLHDTYNSEMWCAGYIMNGGCSDDCFEYFRNWIISRGKDTYFKAKENPDSLVNEVVAGQYDYDFELFWYVALTAFEKNTGKELYDYIDYENFTTHEGKYPKFEFNWQEEKPETIIAICPKLYENFSNK